MVYDVLYAPRIVKVTADTPEQARQVANVVIASDANLDRLKPTIYPNDYDQPDQPAATQIRFPVERLQSAVKGGII
jgi:hypothetical protein